jgi:hypothetical protein
MPSNSEGGNNPSAESGSGGGQSNNSRNSSRRNQTPKESRFEGSCDDLKASVYDVTAGKDTFLKTTRKIAEYVGREYTDAGEYRLAMINLDLAPLVEPVLPAADNANGMVLELWKMSRRT